MAGKYDATELLFDDGLGLSGSKISEGEGEHTYCYRGEACLTKESEDFGSIVLQASLWMNQSAIVKEQLEMLSRGI